MSYQGIQRKPVHHIFAGTEPGGLRRGDPTLIKQRATDWLRARGLIQPYRGRTRNTEKKP